MIRILKEALEEEKAACMALQLELEKERAAAATAADEAMAMILRLQADRASIEMEARQYQRMIEEKCEYEEEEMNIMKDILVRRERENHFLEKEVEAYRQMRSLGNGQSEVDFSHLTSEWGQKPLRSLDSNEDLLEFEKGKSFDKNKVEKAANWSSNYEASSAEMTSEAAQICQKKILSCCGQKLEKVEEDGTEVCGNLQCPKLDAEPIVYDVHVVDDKTELQMEENGKEDGLSNYVATDSGGSNSEMLSDCTSSRVAETNQFNHSSFEMKDGITVLGNSRSKLLPPDPDRNFSSAFSVEKSKIDIEVEFLRERLRKVQEGKEKLTISADHWEIINAQLKLVEEIMNQLGQMQQPMRQASLPPSSSKSKTYLVNTNECTRYGVVTLFNFLPLLMQNEVLKDHVIASDLTGMWEYEALLTSYLVLKLIVADFSGELELEEKTLSKCAFGGP
ncbi:myosin-binding protein 2-like [Pistacia vera]|uniref:myosin-binding protein 2-like n=1 Tax=Pistacia vera TaxID=55513 RepID=UPI0012636671|nr:myosin-binding protein 2-like [Pistacia vera]